jgi:hypothetical protein
MRGADGVAGRRRDGLGRGLSLCPSPCSSSLFTAAPPGADPRPDIARASAAGCAIVGAAMHNNLPDNLVDEIVDEK